MDSKPPMPFPPPVLALLLMLITRLLGVGAPKLSGSLWRILGYLFVAAGVGLGVSGFSWFKLKRTPVRPGARPTQLVTDGVFQFTRNPMYLGTVIFLIGWAFLRRTPIALVAGPLFYAIIDRWQIPFEESLLTEHFGNEFQEYCARVKRWL